MHGLLIIMRWELSRIFTNWRRAVAVFIIPAAVMMVALYIFPYLINYMATGSLGEKPIKVANAPDSFIEYLEETEGTTVYSYIFMDDEEFREEWKSGRFRDEIKAGTIYTFFSKDDDIVYINCNANSAISINRAESYIEVVIDNYNASLKEQGSIVYEIDSFNPVIKLLDHRTAANAGSARVIPAVLVLLIYYCVYSLTTDMFASERDRGFYDKLLMAPVSPRSIVLGKILACTALVSVASYVTFLFLFLSSWVNRSNSSTSLIPFGLFLLPRQILVIAIVIPVTVFLCASICVRIIFRIRRMKDVILNLQMPLIYLLADLFFQIFSANPGHLEFLIPIHGSIAVIKAVFLSEFRLWQLIAVLIISIGPSMLLLHNTFKKEGYTG
ncbi:MAG: ABC transporter permease [Clostridiales bacterium]|nr:ABC transporter permease [Clostridiales bacterium]